MPDKKYNQENKPADTDDKNAGRKAFEQGNRQDDIQDSEEQNKNDEIPGESPIPKMGTKVKDPDEEK